MNRRIQTVSQLPLDARIRELWKAAAISAAESAFTSEECVELADDITLAFIDRFYPSDMNAGQQRNLIMKARNASE